MRNLKKFLALVLAMVMVVGASAVVSADFTDVAADNAYATAINDLAVKGIVRGTSDTTFSPDADVQRYQMALFVARAATGEVGTEADSTLWANGIVPFTDVTEYKGAIQYAFLNGIIKGTSDTTFAPAGNIKYVDALTMAVRALGYTDLEYPWGFYNKAVALGLTDNVAVDALDTTLDRAETAQIIYNMIYAKRANSDVHFAAENFDLDVVRTSDLFVITATPLQSYAAGYGSADLKEEGTYVGVQPLVDGVPEGEPLYIPVEKLGIEAADVENYINYAVELVDYNEKTGEYYAANLGNAPVRVYTDKVTFETDKNGVLVANSTKIVIDGVNYNLVDSIQGSVLKNELVAFAGTDINVYESLYLLEIGNTVVDKNGKPVATAIGYYGNTKYYAAQVDVPEAGIEAGTIITEAQAQAAWGYKNGEVKYTKYATLDVADIDAMGGFELQLFDDNKDGKYDRASVNKVYLSNYGTFVKEINADKEGKETVDCVVTALAGNTESVDVTYSEELAAGTIFTFTFNETTKYVYVIDKFDYSNGNLRKTDSTDKANDNYKISFGENTYVAKDNWTPAVLDATPVTFSNKDKALSDIENTKAGLFFELDTGWQKFIDTAVIGAEYDYLTYNGYILFAEPVVAASATTEFMVLNEVAGYDFGKVNLDVFYAGQQTEVAINKFGNKILTSLSDWYFGIFLGDIANFYKGNIYAINNTANGVNILEVINAYTNDADDVAAEVERFEKYGFGLITNADDNAMGVGLLGDDSKMDFTAGTVRYLDPKDKANTEITYKQRLRASYGTIFYFIDYGTGSANQDDTTVSMYVGAPQDASITFDADTRFYVKSSEYGYNVDTTTASWIRSASIIFVINAADTDGFAGKTATKTYGLFTGNPEIAEVATAEDFGVTGYEADTRLYKYTKAVRDLDSGSVIETVYALAPLSAELIYKFDSKGVAYELEEDGSALGYTVDEGIADGFLESFAGSAIDFDYDDFDEFLGLKVDGEEIYDLDDYALQGVTLINIGDDYTLYSNKNMTTVKFVYEHMYITSAWDKIVNLFNKLSSTYGDTPETFAILKDSADDGYIVALYAFD